jgi:DNA polymerase sigma
MNKSYHGGLNSYSIVLMTSTFIENEGINEMSGGLSQLSHNLEQFFHFFGNYFDP